MITSVALFFSGINKTVSDSGASGIYALCQNNVPFMQNMKFSSNIS